MGMRTISLFAAVLAALTLAGCGGDDEPAGGGDPAEISVEEAVDHEGPAVVTGSLLANGDDVKLCAALAESFPPQCGGASLRVEGLKLAEVDGLITEGDVSWTDRPVQLLGIVEDETLTVGENVQT